MKELKQYQHWHFVLCIKDASETIGTALMSGCSEGHLKDMIPRE